MKYILLVTAAIGLVGLGMFAPGHINTSSQERPFVVRVPQEYPTIQQAVDAVAEGGTVLVGPGTYKENIRITKSIRLVGAGQSLVIIQNSLTSEPDRPIFDIKKSGHPIQIYLENFAVMSLHGTPTGISVIGSVQLLAYQLTVSRTDTGFYLGGEVTAILSRVIVKEAYSRGIWNIGGSLTVDNSIIESNGVGISVLFGSLAVTRSLLMKNWVAIEIGGKEAITLIENSITGNEGGLYMALGPDSYMQKQLRDAKQPELGPSLVTMRDNEIVGNSRYGIALVECLRQPDPRLLSIYVASAGIEKSTIAFREQANKIQGNGEADLCPPDYPWPPGFRK